MPDKFGIPAKQCVDRCELNPKHHFERATMAKTISLNSPFDEVRAIRFRRSPLAQAGKVSVAQSYRHDVPDTVIVVYEDGTVWCSTVSRLRGSYNTVNIYPHDKTFNGLWRAMVQAGLISKKTANLARAAHLAIGSTHPGRNISDWSIEDFQRLLDDYGSPAGMRKAMRQYQALQKKKVEEAAAVCNAEYAKRLAKAKKAGTK